MHASHLARFSGLVALALVGSTARAADDPASVERGRVLFQQTCALCHAAGPGGAPGGQGPSLVGVVGRKAAAAPNFTFTKALADSGLTWDGPTLDRYLANPTTAVPGTNMVIQVPKGEDRRDLIAFVSTLRAPVGGVARGRGPAVDPNATDPFDWRHQAPGTKRMITADKLVEPYVTPTAQNNPQVVAQPPDAKLSVPAGFKVELFTKGLNGPRIVRVAPNGDIFIAETRGNRLRVLRAADGVTAPTTDEIFATGLDRPFGIAFYPNGAEPQWIYVANNNSVVRLPYRNGDLKVTGPAEVIVPKLSDTTNGHSTRDIAFSKDGRRLFISVGSASNYGEPIGKKTPEEIKQWEAENALGAAWGTETRRANILVTSPDGKEPVKIFATGIRNPVGLGIDPVTGNLWTSTNERDGLGDDLVPDYVTSVKEGGYYGWPWYYMGNHEEPRLKGARPDLAGKATVPDVLLQAHSAALGITFYTATGGPSLFPAEYRGDLFVALHGSWNRNSRTGYKVVRAKLQNGKPTGEYEDFLTGFVVDGRGVWGRPVGVAVAHDGALLVTEDGNGTMWRISTAR
jgi:glucose/arabinose dehydrogenase/cytochrome c2